MAQNKKTKGKVAINGIPTEGLKVKVFDQDYTFGVPVFSSFLGESTTDSNGTYSISYSPNAYGALPGDEDNINWQPSKPDLYIEVWRGPILLKKSSVKRDVTSVEVSINLNIQETIQNRKTKGKITINGIPTGGLTVKAYDQDYTFGVPVFSSFLGESTTDSNGNYSISYSPNAYGAIPGDEDNINWQSVKPDLYIEVWRGSTLLKKSSVKRDVASETCVIVLDITESETNYSFTELPPEEIATAFPCNELMQWPGYETKTKAAIIDGRDVIIQAWKGYCPSYMPGLVGGVGAEVGIYHKDWQPGMWWPDHQHKKQISFTLINPITKRVFFNAAKKNCWWRHKWMRENSYAQYIQHNTVPELPNYYILKFRIDGKRYIWRVNEDIKEE